MGRDKTLIFCALIAQKDQWLFDRKINKPSGSCRSSTHLDNWNSFVGFNITPKKGYWRNSINSTKFLKCPSYDAYLSSLSSNYSSNNAVGNKIKY